MLMKNCLAVSVVLLALAACKGEDSGKVVADATEEHLFVVNLVPDSVKLKQYLDYHAHIWPEVEAGFRKAGYQQIDLYRYANTVVMRIKVPQGASLDSMGKLAEASHPRCAEWNRLMASYQQGIAGTKPGQTWAEALQFFEYVSH